MNKKFWLWLLLLTGVGALMYGGYQMVTKRMTGDRWDNLVPTFKEKLLAGLDNAARAGLKVMFFEGWRSVEDEQADIDKGTSHLKDPYNGHHVWGMAADVVFADAVGLPSWPDPSIPGNKANWEKLDAAMKEAGLVHPISWDYPHYEDPEFNLAAVRAQYGTDFASYLADNGVPSGDQEASA